MEMEVFNSPSLAFAIQWLRGRDPDLMLLGGHEGNIATWVTVVEKIPTLTKTGKRAKTTYCFLILID